MDAQRQVRFGTLVSTLTLLVTVPQARNACHELDGDFPCNADAGNHTLQGISHAAPNTDLGHGLTAYSFSSKPSDLGYADYYAKMATYAWTCPDRRSCSRASACACLRSGERKMRSACSTISTRPPAASIGALTSKLEERL